MRDEQRRCGVIALGGEQDGVEILRTQPCRLECSSVDCSRAVWRRGGERLQACRNDGRGGAVCKDARRRCRELRCVGGDDDLQEHDELLVRGDQRSAGGRKTAPGGGRVARAAVRFGGERAAAERGAARRSSANDEDFGDGNTRCVCDRRLECRRSSSGVRADRGRVIAGHEDDGLHDIRALRNRGGYAAVDGWGGGGRDEQVAERCGR